MSLSTHRLTVPLRHVWCVLLILSSCFSAGEPSLLVARGESRSSSSAPRVRLYADEFRIKPSFSRRGSLQTLHTASSTLSTTASQSLHPRSASPWRSNRAASLLEDGKVVDAGTQAYAPVNGASGWAGHHRKDGIPSGTYAHRVLSSSNGDSFVSIGEASASVEAGHENAQSGADGAGTGAGTGAGAGDKRMPRYDRIKESQRVRNVYRRERLGRIGLLPKYLPSVFASEEEISLLQRQQRQRENPNQSLLFPRGWDKRKVPIYSMERMSFERVRSPNNGVNEKAVHASLSLPPAGSLSEYQSLFPAKMKVPFHFRPTFPFKLEAGQRRGPSPHAYLGSKDSLYHLPAKTALQSITRHYQPPVSSESSAPS